MSTIEHIESIQQYSWNEFLADINARKEDSLSINHFSNNKVEGTISLNSPKMLFFLIPFDKGWSATINGTSVKLLNINIGFMGIPLGKGNFEIELYLTLLRIFLLQLLFLSEGFLIIFY